MSIDPKRAIVDLLGVSLQAMRAASDIANNGTENHGLYTKLSVTTGMLAGIVMEVARTTEDETENESDALSPFEAEIMQMVHAHGTIRTPSQGTPGAYALLSLVKRGKLMSTRPGSGEYVIPCYLPIGEGGKPVAVGHGLGKIYRAIMDGAQYDPKTSQYSTDMVIKSCQRLVDAGLAIWREGKLMKKPNDIPGTCSSVRDI